MDDPELALEKAVQQLDSESSADSEVNDSESCSVVENGHGIYGGNKQEQAFNNMYRTWLMQRQQPGGGRNLNNSIQNSVSGSEDNSSIASFENSDAGAKSAIFSQSRPPTTSRLTVSDTEGTRHHRSKSSRQRNQTVFLTENKTVTREEFVLRVHERLVAVSKDRDAMTLKARDLQRQQGKSYEEIMSAQWFDLPEAFKYLMIDETNPAIPAPLSNGVLHPPSSHHPLSPLEVRSPDPNPANKNAQGQLAGPQGTMGQPGMPAMEAEEPWHMTTQQQQQQQQHQQVHRKRHSHRHTSGPSSVFSATSDSGVGGDGWAANEITPPTTDRLHAYVQRQNIIASRLPERERTAQAAAIALISNSPQPDSLSPLPGHHQQHQHQQHRDNDRHTAPSRRHMGHYSSDDSSSVFTITSQSSTSDLFIPRRANNHPLYAESDDQHHFSSRSNRRTLTIPKTSRNMKNHAPSPLAEQHQQHRQMPPQQTQRAPNHAHRGDVVNTLVMYTLDDLPTPFAKRLSGSDLTLKDFKERVFLRKGEFRFFFKYFCPDVNMELFEEFSDDLTLLPLVDNKIVGRVEKLPTD